MNELFNEKRTKRRNAQHSGQLAAAAQQAKIGGIESFAAGGSDERTLPHRFGLGRPLRRRVGVVERRVEHQFAVQRQRQGQHGLVDAVARQRRRIHDARLQDQVEEDSPQGGQHHVQRRSRVRFVLFEPIESWSDGSVTTTLVRIYGADESDLVVRRLTFWF